MTQEKTEEFRVRLEELESEIERNLRLQEEESRSVSGEQHTESVDEAQARTETYTRDVMHIHDEKRLVRIRGALRRIREGRYGICAACGAPISDERLDARPEAAFCITCERTIRNR